VACDPARRGGVVTALETGAGGSGCRVNEENQAWRNCCAPAKLADFASRMNAKRGGVSKREGAQWPGVVMRMVEIGRNRQIVENMATCFVSSQFALIVVQSLPIMAQRDVVSVVAGALAH